METGVCEEEVGEFCEWVDAISPDPDTCLTVIRASIDEASTHDPDLPMCVAVVAGTSTQWKKWAEAWYPAAEKALGSVTEYHANRNNGALNDLLASLIYKHMDCAHAFVMSDIMYRDNMREDKRGLVGSAYCLGVHASLTSIGEYYWRKKTAAVVLEAGHGHETEVTNYLNGILTKGPDFQRRLCFRSHTWVGKEEPAIHPADLVSWAVARAGPRGSDLTRILRHKLAVTAFGLKEIQDFNAAIPSASYVRKLRKQWKREGL